MAKIDKLVVILKIELHFKNEVYFLKIRYNFESSM
jgi:hypothetical protein